MTNESILIRSILQTLTLGFGGDRPLFAQNTQIMYHLHFSNANNSRTNMPHTYYSGFIPHHQQLQPHNQSQSQSQVSVSNLKSSSSFLALFQTIGTFVFTLTLNRFKCPVPDCTFEIKHNSSLHSHCSAHYRDSLPSWISHSI